MENRPGAGATIGTEAAAKALPDGHTLFMGGSVALTISPALYRKVAYDAARDFAPVALISRFHLVLATHPSLPVRNVKELIALARSRPGDLVMASGGSGTTSHLTGALFESMAKVKLLHVPYKSGESTIAILRGEAQLSFTPVSLAQQGIRSGKLRVLGVTSAERIAPLPDVPAIAETLPGFQWSGWQVLMVPAATPADVVKRLQTATQEVVRMPEFRGHLDREGSELFQAAPGEFPQFLREEIAKNAKLVRLSGARVD